MELTTLMIRRNFIYCLDCDHERFDQWSRSKEDLCKCSLAAEREMMNGYYDWMKGQAEHSGPNRIICLELIHSMAHRITSVVVKNLSVFTIIHILGVHLCFAGLTPLNSGVTFLLSAVLVLDAISKDKIVMSDSLNVCNVAVARLVAFVLVYLAFGGESR